VSQPARESLIAPSGAEEMCAAPTGWWGYWLGAWWEYWWGGRWYVAGAPDGPAAECRDRRDRRIDDIRAGALFRDTALFRAVATEYRCCNRMA
jgi:hypothetical protein